MLRAVAVLIALVCIGGCSLLSLQSPAKPLPRRDLNARMLTHDYALRFMTTVERAANDISARSSDPVVDLAALRWKIGAASASQRAATQMAPMMGLLDSWALSSQMRQFLTDGAGSTLFGELQPGAQATALDLERDIVKLAGALTSVGEFNRFQQFVDGYVRDHPLTSIEFNRASVVDLWVSQTGQQATLLSTLGTAPEAMGDVTDRMRLYSESVPRETLWQSQLALNQAGYGKGDLRLVLTRMDDRLAAIGKLADTSPELVHGAIADLRGSLFQVTGRLDRSWMSMMQVLKEERMALAENVRDERIGITQAADTQRLLIMKDAGRIAVQVTETSWQHLRALVRELAIEGMLALILILGLPFVAGYFLGRTRGQGANRVGTAPRT
jgi:hypothetical protein